MLLSRWVPLLVPRPVCGQTHRGPPASALKGSRTTLIACVRPTRHPVTAPARRQTDGRAPLRRLGAMHGNGGYGNPGSETAVDTRFPLLVRVSPGVRCLPGSGISRCFAGGTLQIRLVSAIRGPNFLQRPDADRIAPAYASKTTPSVQDSANSASVSPPSPLVYPGFDLVL